MSDWLSVVATFQSKNVVCALVCALVFWKKPELFYGEMVIVHYLDKKIYTGLIVSKDCGYLLYK